MIPEESASAGWSRESGFVHVTAEYIVHEVFIARMLERLEVSAMEPLADLYRQIVEEGR